MGEGGGIRRQTPQKLTMESYLDFIHSNKQLDLTVSQLNQIIDMHGFKKMHRTHKSDLMEAVRTMDLLDPSRSTLGDAGVSSDAFITLDDLIKDIKELQWQECCITSLQTINAVDHDNLKNQTSNNDSNCMALTVASASSAKPRRPRKKRKKLADAAGDGHSSTSFDFGGSQRASCLPLAMKLLPRKRRGLTSINLNLIDNHGDGGLGGSAVSVTDLQSLESSSSAFLPLGSL